MLNICDRFCRLDLVLDFFRADLGEVVEHSGHAPVPSHSNTVLSN